MESGLGACGFFSQRFAAPFLASSARRFGSITEKPFGTFFLPPFRPRATAARSFLLAIGQKHNTKSKCPKKWTAFLIDCLKRLWHTEHMTPRFTSASCPLCNTYFDRLPVESDEDGGYAHLEVHLCADPSCGALLCPCCAQVHCDGCGQTFCADHLVQVADGTPRPLHCCPGCAAESEQAEFPPKIEPQRETIWPSATPAIA